MAQIIQLNNDLDDTPLRSSPLDNLRASSKDARKKNIPLVASPAARHLTLGVLAKVLKEDICYHIKVYDIDDMPKRDLMIDGFNFNGRNMGKYMKCAVKYIDMDKNLIEIIENIVIK